MSLHTYVNQIKKLYKSGISTEHSYRGDLQVLLTDMVPGIIVTNEPKRQECGAPDYIIQRKQVPLGYIEAKDIGIDLNKIEKSEQLKRYLKSLDNLILTDYLDFRFFRYGEKVGEIHLGEVTNGKISVFYKGKSGTVVAFVAKDTLCSAPGGNRGREIGDGSCESCKIEIAIPINGCL